MKKILHKQTGYALVLVLLIIAIIGIFTPVIFSKLINNTKQIEISEERIQLQELSNMGVVFVDKTIDYASSDAEKQTISWLKEIQEQMEEDDSIVYPSVIEVRSKYRTHFIVEIGKYILIDEAFEIENEDETKIKIEIKTPSNLNGDTMTIKYKISPSINGKDFELEGERQIIITGDM